MIRDRRFYFDKDGRQIDQAMALVLLSNDEYRIIDSFRTEKYLVRLEWTGGGYDSPPIMPLVFGIFAHLVDPTGVITQKDTRPRLFSSEEEGREAFAGAVAHYQRVEVTEDGEIDRSQDLDAPKDLTIVDADCYDGAGDW